MTEKEKTENLEFRVFELEQNFEILNKNFDKLTEELAFYYNKSEDSQKNPILNRDQLFDIREASEIFNISISEIKNLIRKDEIKPIVIANQLYFDKLELRESIRTIILKKNKL